MTCDPGPAAPPALQASSHGDTPGMIQLERQQIVWGDATLHALLGYRDGELINQPASTVFADPGSYTVFVRTSASTMAANGVYSGEFELRRKDGTLGWFAICLALRHGGPHIALAQAPAVSGNIVEITGRKRTEQQLQLQAQILAHLSDAICLSSTKGLFLYTNPAFDRLFGYEYGELLGLSIAVLDTAPGADPVTPPAKILETLTANGRWHGERVQRHRAGTAVRTHAALSTIELPLYGTVWLSVQREITTERRLARATEDVAQAAEDLVRLKSAFINNMSHELLTPLHQLLGYAEIGGKNPQDPERAQAAFTKIKVTGQKLLTLIQSVIDLAQLEAGNGSIAKRGFDLRQLINEAVEVIRDEANAKALPLHVNYASGLPPTCFGDPERLKQILSHLIANAVRFTDTGQVTIAVDLQQERMVIRVTDTGIGMDRRQLQRIFEPFQQPRGPCTERFGGTDVGLATCKRLAELLGGELGVTSAPGVGSSFELQLPYEPWPPVC